ncbi:MAG: glutamate-5-semialdehyde dehydrogenase [Treponema sp.]|nr:glutamate-5-semialdehyde dehydrogenase [Treponema sp.]
MNAIDGACYTLRAAARRLAHQTAAQKNRALALVADSLNASRTHILAANSEDASRARASGMTDALVERLLLSNEKIDSILSGIHVVRNHADPIGEEVAGWRLPNGMQVRQVRVPLGVVAIIYESRPNVTVDAFALAYKSGNAILLRGSLSAIHTNRALVSAITTGLQAAGADGIVDALSLLDSASHDDVHAILYAVGKIDVVLPRGGKNLIDRVVRESRIPVIETGSGVCHVYVDEGADITMAVAIAENAKIQRPGACNAIEAILVHKSSAARFLPALAERFGGRVELRADEYCLPLLQAAGSGVVQAAAPDDYGAEFLDYVCVVCAVDSIAAAIDYINTHNTQHSECIVTNNYAHARLFQEQVDAACVYVNSSTRFTDGGEFGFGAELGISTQKLHARGPMGMTALTTTKYLITGEGQIR